jgi:hypothetical protein
LSFLKHEIISIRRIRYDKTFEIKFCYTSLYFKKHFNLKQLSEIMSKMLKYDKQDQQGKAAFNEHKPPHDPATRTSGKEPRRIQTKEETIVTDKEIKGNKPVKTVFSMSTSMVLNT